MFVTTLAAAMARLRPGVLSNAVDPGWVPTKSSRVSVPGRDIACRGLAYDLLGLVRAIFVAEELDLKFT
jgi:hypothetical protein